MLGPVIVLEGLAPASPGIQTLAPLISSCQWDREFLAEVQSLRS